MWSTTPTRQIFVKFYIFGLLCKSVKELHIWLQLDNNVSQCIWRPNFVGDVDLPYYCCAENNIFLLLTVTWSSSVQETHCCISTAEIVKGTFHNDGYVHCLSCYHVKLNAAWTHYMCFPKCVCTILWCWIFESMLCRLMGHGFQYFEGPPHSS